MRIVMFYHSLLSDWNHGNAHFLRGIASELIARGHRVDIYEPADSWSLQSLLQEHGTEPLRKFQEAYPLLRARRYRFGAQIEAERVVPPHSGPLPQGEGRAGERAANFESASHDSNARQAQCSNMREQRDMFLPLPKGEGRGEGERDWRTTSSIVSPEELPLPTPITLDLDEALDGADLVIVHEWNAHELVRSIGEHRARNDYVLLFHDTHHRMITQPDSMAAYDLSNYDGVLAYGEVLRELYEARGNVARAWTWHEAADTRVFKPALGRAGCRQPAANGADAQDGAVRTPRPAKDLVWVGNWGDDERTAELHEFLIGPAKELKLSARVYGVRYPAEAQNALRNAGIEYGNWLSNFEAPRVFAEFKFTIHVPRRPYVKTLPGIPTIRPFEALACGVPLICSPWNDAERLFRPGTDYLVANNGAEMEQHMRAVLNDPQLAAELARNGLETIRQRHTCAHRVDELLKIYEKLAARTPRIAERIDSELRSARAVPPHPDPLPQGEGTECGRSLMFTNASREPSAGQADTPRSESDSSREERNSFLPLPKEEERARLSVLTCQHGVECDSAVPPHPGALPEGEGTAGGRSSMFTSASCKCSAGQADAWKSESDGSREERDSFLPLPKGEGRGEGEGDVRKFKRSESAGNSEQCRTGTLHPTKAEVTA